MNKSLIFSGVKNVQFLFFILTGLISLFFLGFLFLEQTLFMLVFSIMVIIVFTLFNYYLSSFYNIKIDDGIITIENIWKTHNYLLKDLIDIKRVKFILPYPINPYIKFEFRDKKVFFTKANPYKIYMTKGGIGAYISNLKNEYLSRPYSEAL